MAVFKSRFSSFAKTVPCVVWIGILTFFLAAPGLTPSAQAADFEIYGGGGGGGSGASNYGGAGGPPPPGPMATVALAATAAGAAAGLRVALARAAPRAATAAPPWGS